MLSNLALHFEISVDYLSMPKIVMHKLPYLYFTALQHKCLEFLTIFDLFQRCKMQKIPTVQGDDELKPFFSIMAKLEISNKSICYGFWFAIWIPFYNFCLLSLTKPNIGILLP